MKEAREEGKEKREQVGKEKEEGNQVKEKKQGRRQIDFTFRQLAFSTDSKLLHSCPLNGIRANPFLRNERLSLQKKKHLFLIPLPGRGVGREGGKWGNLGVLGERAHGEKSQFGKQRWNHNLWSPFCPCRPVIPTPIKGKEREATGKSNKSRLRGDALGFSNK